MIFRPILRERERGKKNEREMIYHYLADFMLHRDDYKGTLFLFHGNFTKQSCLFTLTRPSICKLLSNSAPTVTASFGQVFATRESPESIARELDSCNFSFRREESYSGHRSL